MNIQGKEYTAHFSLAAMCKLEELGLDVFAGGLGKISATVLKKLMQAGLMDNHSQEEIDNLLKVISPKEAVAFSEELGKAFKEAIE